jgi:hypothetical protein
VEPLLPLPIDPELLPLPIDPELLPEPVPMEPLDESELLPPRVPLLESFVDPVELELGLLLLL